MKFNLIVESRTGRLAFLRRVRIKIDPEFLSKEGEIKSQTSYEGYVLEEGLETIKVLMLSPNVSIEEFPPEFVEYVPDQEGSDGFSALKNFIISNAQLSENDPLIDQIKNSSCFGEIETFLMQAGLSEKGILDIYRSFIEQNNE